MDVAAAEQIARLLAQVEPLSRDNDRLAADNARLARDAAEAGRAHQGVVRDAVADRLVLNGKHVNALPLYRMEYDLKCLGAPISRQNMAN